MERISAPPLPEKSRALRATLAGGTLAGVLDLSAAFVNGAFNGVSPVRVTQAIASGLLGAESYKGGDRLSRHSPAFFHRFDGDRRLLFGEPTL